MQRLCRLISLSAFACAALQWPAALAWLIPTLSPHVAAGSAIGRYTLILTSLCGIPALLLVLWRARWICRWACPVGLVLEGCGTLRGRRGRSYRHVPPLGRWLALVTLGGALAGVPLFLWLDPLAILGGAFEGLRWPITLASAAPALALAGVLTLSVLLPGLWCAKLCPLGGTQEFLSRLGGLIRPRARRQAGKRVLARHSLIVRRGLLVSVAGALSAYALRLAARPSASRRLLPPGTVSTDELAGRCIRCGNCVRACPVGIIHQDRDAARPHMLLTPVIRMDGKHCLPDCHACTQSCPSGAIARLTLAEKNAWPIGLARIDLPNCYLTDEIECGHCARICPYNAIEEGFSEDTWTAFVRVNPAKCNGCGACLSICPPKVITLQPVRPV